MNPNVIPAADFQPAPEPAAPIKFSRQVRRANQRQAQKEMTKRQNEEIGGKNRMRGSSVLQFLNRAGRRKFRSNRCPAEFKDAVIEARDAKAA